MFRKIITGLWCAGLLLLCRDAFPGGGYSGKRIFWVESYHDGYAWTDGITRGVKSALQESGVELQVFHLDTKRNGAPEFALQAAMMAYGQMRSFRPDVVMASDDNAQRYFVLPYLGNGTIPVTFCGINWDASEYGYPKPHITGMIEVTLLAEGRQMLGRFAQGHRVVYLAAYSESEMKNLRIYNDKYFHGSLPGRLVRTMDEFMAAFEQAQQSHDMLILGGNGGILGWNEQAVQEFITAHTRIPTCSFDDYLMNYAVFTFAKDPAEQGECMASTALRILDGVVPTNIPVVENRRVRLIVNLRLAKAAGITLPVALLKTATVIGKDQ